ncbi:MAG: hypothetical protein SGCHY_004459, partial [Lobulomycetales sp.]
MPGYSTHYANHPMIPLQEDDFLQRANQALEPITPYMDTKFEIQQRSPDTKFLPAATSFSEASESRIIYFITPTYYRPSQLVDFTRLKHTLELAAMKVHKLIYWIVIEDSATGCTTRVRELLDSTGLLYAHDFVKTPKNTPHRGVSQRNLALDIVEKIGLE